MFEVLTAVLSVMLILQVHLRLRSDRRWEKVADEWMHIASEQAQAVKDLEAIVAVKERTEKLLRSTIRSNEEAIELYQKKLGKPAGKYRKIS